MTTMLEPILGSLDNRIVIIFIVIMVICLILAIIKKVFKVALFVAALAIIATIIMPIASDFQDKYQFSLESGTAVITIDGQEFKMDRVQCKSIEMENKGSGGYELRADMGDEGVLDIIVPTFMLDSVKHFAERYGIPIEIRE